MKKENGKSRWIVAFFIIVFLGLISMILAGFVGIFLAGDVQTGNVALIAVSGTIITDNPGGLFSQGVASSTDIVELIRRADEDVRIKAIVLEINSPGGSAVASDEIGTAIKKSNKTTVAWIREVGASGGYWVASGTDHIIANRMSITGSIGVIGSYLDFSGLINRYNVTYERLVAGKYKDAGVPFRELQDDEREQIQKILDDIHEEFINEVAKNRDLDRKYVRNISTGMIYLGSEAKRLGLVDEVGGKEEVIDYLEENLNITVEIVEFKKERTFIEALSGVFAPKPVDIGSVDLLPRV